MIILSEFFLLLANALLVLNIIFAIVVVFYERKNPAVTWAWLMVILILPYFGFIFYLILGLDSRKYRVFAYKARDDEELYLEFMGGSEKRNKFLTEQYGYIYDKEIFTEEGNRHFNDMIYLNFVSGNGVITRHNKLSIYQSGETKFESLLSDIAGAKKFVHIQYYIVRDGDIGRRIISALADAARRGVEVRFLIDGMGCAGTPKKFYKPLLDAGGLLGIFLPPSFIRINFRNHRKLAIIDGGVGYIGGLNIGDEYLGKSKRFGYWRDSHIRISGDAVVHLNLRFIMDWNFCSQEKITPDMRYLTAKSDPEGHTNVQLVSSGPDTKWPSIQYAYQKMIAEADKSVYIQTPYFVPDDSVFETLRISALAGNDVRIVIPAHPDHPFVYWAGLSYLGELISAGVKCYKYEKGFLHSKLVIVDGLVSSVGTANMDVRSFKLNFETNAFIYDKDTAEELTKKFLTDLRDCTEISEDWYANRSQFTKVRESVSRLLSPML